MAPSPVLTTIAVQDSAGNTITSSTAVITIAIGVNPGGGTLSGTTIKNAAGGVTVFAELRIDQAGNGYTLTATSAGLTSATANAFNITSGGGVAGTVSKAAGGGAITGASIQALQAGVVKGTASTNSVGNYTITGLAPGAYDIRADGGGFSPQTQNGITVNTGTTTTVNFSLANAAPTAGIVYLYDELQRLKSVVDPVGEAATYTYDAVGNLLSITRNTSSQTSIIDFNPNSGPVGATVTIYGTGYSATPSENSVTFNGVAATVVSSTLTQIVATVPAGATTGPISVTSPAGGATSSTNFTVTGSPLGPPTIASFTPTIGTVGTAITITGTNFDTTPTNNEVYFNPTFAAVTGATATTLNTTVPVSGRSGKLAVSTAGGTATSAQDFFVPPSPFTANDVDFTGRLSVGGPGLAMPVATANKIGLALFDGVAGQRISMNVTNSTFGGSSTVKIITPEGFTIVNTTWTTSTGVFQDALSLPVTGTYTVLLDPSGTLTGQATVQLYSATDITGPIVPGGDSVSLTFTNAGQNARLTFTASGGDKVSGLFTAGTLTCCYTAGTVSVSIIKPNGATLASFGGYWTDGWRDAVTLPDTGIYTLLVDPTGTSTGTGTVQLWAVTDITGSITPGGASVPLTFTTPGQNANLTFSASAGDKVSGYLTAGSLLCCGNGGSGGNVQAWLLKPDGTTLSGSTFGGYWADGWMDTVTLPIAGTYTLFVTPGGAATGTATLQLYAVTDITGSITPGGASVPISITTPGQNAYYSFNATSGDKISGTYTAGTNLLCCGNGGFSGNVLITIRKPPDWQTSVGSFSGYWSNGSLGTTTLPDTGEYRVFVDPQQATTGSGTVQLFVVP